MNKQYALKGLNVKTPRCVVGEIVLGSSLFMQTLRIIFAYLIAFFLVAVGSHGTTTLYVPDGTVGTLANSNIGIGTNSPTEKLQVSGGNILLDNQAVILAKDSGGTTRTVLYGRWSDNATYIAAGTGGFYLRTNNGATNAMYVGASGNVGIGTNSPSYLLDVHGNIALTGNRSVIFTSGDNVTTHRGGVQFLTYNNGVTNIWTPTDQYGTPQNSTIRFGGFAAFNSTTVNLAVSGNVGIGTTDPVTYKLAVVGKVRAQEIVVDTGWSDYVFADDYRLLPLSEVEQHIKAEKHLPGIPSAAEVGKGGISLGQMQAKLLAKIEELTLHQIAQEKIQREQQKAIAQLVGENAALRRKLCD